MVEDEFLTQHEVSSFENYHGTVNAPVQSYWVIENSNPSRPAMSRMRETSERVQRLIKHAVETKTRLRAIGSVWSFSDVFAAEGGWMLATDRLNYIFKVTPSSLASNFFGSSRELIFAQAGAFISEINRKIETPSHDQALRTSGASNGQTIAGALATGTHGSATGVGALQSQVAGLQIITAESNLWLEHPARPTMNVDFARKLGAKLVRDELLFEAALVNLGALGFVHSVVLRTTGRYLLKSYRQNMLLSQVRRAINTLDFSNLNLPEADTDPYFFQVVIDPGGADSDVYVTTRYKICSPPSYKPDYKLESGHQLNNDLPGIVGELIENLPSVGPPVVSALLKTRQKPIDSEPKTPGETYDRTSGRKGVLGAALGVPIRYSGRAVDIARKAIADEFGPIILALRFVQKTPGLLSFTRFDPTCVLDLDGLNTSSARSVIERTMSLLDEAGIPYTQHWGKIHDLTPIRLERAYGSRIGLWKSARELLLPNSIEREVFANEMLGKLGLS